jgi:hypothetical protein
MKSWTKTELFLPSCCKDKDSPALPRIPSRSNTGTEVCSNTEALDEVGDDAKDDEKGADVTLLIKVVEGTALADPKEAEAALNSDEESKMLDKAKSGFCFMSKSFVNLR